MRATYPAISLPTCPDCGNPVGDRCWGCAVKERTTEARRLTRIAHRAERLHRACADCGALGATFVEGSALCVGCYAIAHWDELCARYPMPANPHTTGLTCRYCGAVTPIAIEHICPVDVGDLYDIEGEPLDVTGLEPVAAD